MLALGLVLGCGKRPPDRPLAPALRARRAPHPRRPSRFLARARRGGARGRRWRCKPAAPGSTLPVCSPPPPAFRTRLFRREPPRRPTPSKPWSCYGQQARARAARSALRCTSAKRALLEGGAETATPRQPTARSMPFRVEPMLGCAAHLESALTMLAAFRPSDSALAALEPRAPPEASSSAAPTSPSAQAPSGAVATATLTHIERYSAKGRRARRGVRFESSPLRGRHRGGPQAARGHACSSTCVGAHYSV